VRPSECKLLQIVGFCGMFSCMMKLNFAPHINSVAGETSEQSLLKVMQEHIFQCEKLISLGILAAGLAHEIKNPLSSIQSFAQLLPEKYDDEEFRNNFSKVVARDVNRISKLTDNILSLAKPTPTQLSIHNINDIIDETLSLVNGEILENKTHVIKSYSKSIAIKGNKEALKQVFLNIILNAIHSMPNGGALNISSSMVSMSDMQDLKKNHNYVRVEIQDTGCGIEKKLLSKLFDPFFTNKTQGTGLGLALAQRIIEQHNGSIGVSSKLGEGATFWIILPVSRIKNG